MGTHDEICQPSELEDRGAGNRRSTRAGRSLVSARGQQRGRGSGSLCARDRQRPLAPKAIAGGWIDLVGLGSARWDVDQRSGGGPLPWMRASQHRRLEKGDALLGQPNSKLEMSHRLRAFEPLLRIGLGLFALAILGGLCKVLSRWLGLPVIVVFPVILGVAAVIATTVWIVRRSE